MSSHTCEGRTELCAAHLICTYIHTATVCAKYHVVVLTVTVEVAADCKRGSSG